MGIKFKQTAASERYIGDLICMFGALLLFIALPARASLIEVVFDVPDGYALSLNGSAAAPSGRVVATAYLDNTTPNRIPNFGSDYGDFAVDQIFLTIEGFNIYHQQVIPQNQGYPSLYAYPGGFHLKMSGLFDGIGWNGSSPSSAALMTDPGDLTTLPIGTTAAFVSSFFGGPLQLASGAEITGGIGANGPDGIFTVNASPVPLPATLPLLVSAMAVLIGFGRRKQNPQHTYPA